MTGRNSRICIIPWTFVTFVFICSLLAEKDKLERKVNIQGGDKKDD